MKSIKIATAVAVLGFFGLSGVAVAAASGEADPRLGEQVDRICFARTIDNFEVIEGEDDAVLLEAGVNDWYKATLIGACNYRQLKWAQGVALDSRPGGGCVTPGDQLIFSRSAFGDFSFPNTTRCVIDDIYRWNPDAEKATDKAAEPTED